MQCFVSWGSNLGEQASLVESALKAIDDLEGITLVAISPWYRSAAVGPGNQNDYLNGVIEIDTELSPLQLLDALQRIESSLGRERLIRWGPRTIDLDILYYDNRSIDTSRLTVPHPRCTERNFVLRPWSDISPNTELFGKKVSELALELTDDQLFLWQDEAIN